MLVAKTVLKNTTDQNVLSLISCKPVMTFARDLRFAFCLSVRDLSTDCEGSIHHRESAEALQIKALRGSHGTGFHTGTADGKSGRMMSVRVTLYKICSHFIFVLKDYRLLIKETLSCACWYLALLHWPFRVTHSRILKVDALKRLTVVQAGRANEQRSANYFLREQP